MPLTWIQRRTADALLAKAREAVKLVQAGHQYDGRFYDTARNIFSVNAAVHICTPDRSVSIDCVDSFGLLVHISQTLQDEGYTVSPIQSLPISSPDPAWQLIIRVPQ